MRSRVPTGHSGRSELGMAAFLTDCVGCGICAGERLVMGLEKDGVLVVARVNLESDSLIGDVVGFEGFCVGVCELDQILVRCSICNFCLRRYKLLRRDSEERLKFAGEFDMGEEVVEGESMAL